MARTFIKPQETWDVEQIGGTVAQLNLTRPPGGGTGASGLPGDFLATRREDGFQTILKQTDLDKMEEQA